MITHHRLKELLSYDPDTGLFKRSISTGRHGCHKKGAFVGCHCKHHGYIFIRLDGVLYRAHRLVWLYVHGEFPIADIDHINGIRHDNRLCNLRDVTRSENLQNTLKAKGESGLRGAYTHKNGRWRSSISVDGVEKKLGWFATAEEAHQVYTQAKNTLHPYRPTL